MNARPVRRLRRRVARTVVLWLAALAARGGAARIRRFGRFIGAAHYALSRPFTGRLRRDIARALGIPPGTARAALSTAYRENDRAVFEIIALADPACDIDALAASVTIHESDRIRHALGQGRGLILLGMHMGNGILMAAALARRGIPMTVVYRDPRRLPAGLLGRSLERAGLDAIALDRDNPTRSFRQMMRLLARGEALYVLMDQANKTEGTSRKFLGKTVRMPIGVPTLGIRTRAPIVPVHAEAADPDWVFRAHTPLAAETAEAMLDAVIASMEAAIRAHPELWAWHHRRWKRYHFES